MPAHDMSSPLAAVDALILCGGSGTRLRPVIADRPKGLALIGGKPFLDILIEDLLQQGVRRIIFCVGHLGDQIISRYAGRAGAEYLFSREGVPLGTGGAIRNALHLSRGSPFLVMNGDSLCQVALEKFLAFHQGMSASLSIVLTRPDERHDGGMVYLDENQRIRTFLEKSSDRSRDGGLINAGIYMLQRDSIEHCHLSSPFSLEYDVFPQLVGTAPCFGFVVESRLTDIGTPERYQKANTDWPKNA